MEQDTNVVNETKTVKKISADIFSLLLNILIDFITQWTIFAFCCCFRN